MSKRITVDPISRIEGHLRVDVEVDGGKVSKAWSSCTMWRGIENILLGRDPREAWLFTQRFCGVCTTVHAMASVRAVEDAIGLEIPDNAQYIRNLILIAHSLHDHIVHFYHLSALDFVDILEIPKADPAKAAAIAQSLSEWPGNSAQAFKAAQDKVKAVAASGQMGIFTNGYWGHPAMKLSPELNLIAFAHYLQALEYQRKALSIVAILGSKTPHIQNLTVGGVANAINLDSQATLNMEKLFQVKLLLGELSAFVQQVYLPDVAAIGNAYPEWFTYGKGVTNYMAAADLPLSGKADKFDLPGGIFFGGNPGAQKPFKDWKSEEFRKAVAEDVTHAFYEGNASLQPWKGETKPAYGNGVDVDNKYSWVKAPRYNGEPMQVGPVAQVLIGHAQGHPLFTKWTNAALSKIKGGSLNSLQSTMGRHAARAIRAAVLTELAEKHWQLLVDNINSGDFTIHNTPGFPIGTVEGVGQHEAPRGLLSHWIVINNGKITNYQAVVPSTWNASPRDAKGVPGPYEASLLDNPVADPERPLEVLRTIHSFDPCLACAVHAFDGEGKQIVKVKAL